MAKTLLIIALFAIQFHASVQSNLTAGWQSFDLSVANNQQNDRPLTLSQIEQLLEIKFEDENIAREVRKLGIAFDLAPATIDRLLKLGMGAKTRQALMDQQVRADFTAYSTEKDPARRLALGREFLQKHRQSSEAANVGGEIRKLEVEVFEAEFQKFSDNPDATGLDRVLMLGRDLLRRRPERATVVQVTSKLALATGRGMLGNFYSDLEQSREYANQALRLLEDTTSLADVDQTTYKKLRTESLSILYQCQGLYLLRQPSPDSEQAIAFLTKAALLKDGPSANDPITFWLRALARDLNFQKLSDEYRALPKYQRAGKQGQSLCSKITEIINQLILDYTQVVSLSSRRDSTQLKDEAIAAINSLATGERPCAGGRSEFIDEWPGEEKRYALVIGAEDYLDKRVSKYNFAASDARAIADALIRHGNFRKENVVLLATGETVDRQPSRSIILQHLADLPNHLKQDGLLLIYFAGHAVEINGKSYLLAADSLTANESLIADTAINVARLKEMILSSGVGQAMIIFDAFRQTPVSENFSRSITFDIRKNELAAFATVLAASPGQRSYESQTKKLSFFSSAFIEAVKGKAANKNRVVTLDDLIKYLQTSVPQEVQKELGSDTRQLPAAVVEGYESDNLVVFLPEAGGQLRSQSAKPDLADLVRSSKAIFVRSKTIYLNPTLLEAELSKLPEFQALNLNLARNVTDADLVVEVTLPFLSWEWNFNLSHRTSGVVIATGKIRELTATTASPKLAKEIAMRLQSLRNPPPTPR